MKVNCNYIFIFLSVILMGSLHATSALAQYENEPAGSEYKDLSQYPELGTSNDDKPLIYEHDRHANRGRDSSHIKMVVAPMSKPKAVDQTKPSTANNKEDDALSFNFLYYIIQKFKISDLVDE